MTGSTDPANVAQALIGSWRLQWARVVDGDAVTDAAPFGAEPEGLLHYLPDGRMAVLIAHGHRPPLAGGRNASDAERVRAARTFVAYAGTFDVAGDRVIHHVEMNSHPNDVGVDYPRFVRLDGDLLELATPDDLPADQRPMCLGWRRLTPYR